MATDPHDRRLDRSRAIELPFSTLREWGDWINEHAVPDTDPQPTILRGTGGRPATEAELEAYLSAHKARIERDREQRRSG